MEGNAQLPIVLISKYYKESNKGDRTDFMRSGKIMEEVASEIEPGSKGLKHREQQK